MADFTVMQSEDWRAMVSGAWYLTNSRTLAAFRKQTKARCNRFNAAEHEQRMKIQRDLLPNVQCVVPGRHFYCDYGVAIHCAGHFTAGDFLTVLDGAPVKIGNGTILGESVVISSVEHHKDPQKRLQGWQKATPVSIGSHVTIGNGVTILPGAIIPDNAVIADGDVVGRR